MYLDNGYTIHRAVQTNFQVKKKFFSRSNDVFGVFDLICKRKDSNTVWIQVTSQANLNHKKRKIENLGNIWNKQDKIIIASYVVKKGKYIIKEYVYNKRSKEWEIETKKRRENG